MESLDQYNRTIVMGLGIVMRNERREILTAKPADRKGRLGAVIFGSDQGLCGSFNNTIRDYALERMKEIRHEERVALAVGDRVVARLEEAGQHVESHFSFFGDHLGITQVMMDVLVKIEEWRSLKGVDQIVLFYNRPVSGAVFVPQMAYIFPLDMKWLRSLAKENWPSRTRPSFSMDIDSLFDALVRQYLFFSLYRAFVESLASENASRLLSMQAAEKNIDDHLAELGVRFQRMRQEAISSELLDIVTGFEAMAGYH